MLRQPFQSHCSARRLASVLSSAILALGLCSCQTDGTPDITGALGEKAEAGRAADMRREVDSYGERFRANPRDAEAALQYGKALRASGQRAQAVAVLELEGTVDEMMYTIHAHPTLSEAMLDGYGAVKGMAINA